MRIGELAERAGTGARTLRYYEEHGRKLADLDTCIARLLMVRGVVSRELAGAGPATTDRDEGEPT